MRKPFSASRKKLKFKDNIHVIVDLSIKYRIVNFLQVFTAIAGYVKCKTCDGEVQFAPIETRGLGFKISVNYEKCEQRKITASAVVDRAYKINRRPCGSSSHEFVENADEKRVSLAEQRAQNATREARMARRQHQLDFLEAASSSEQTLYGPGIDDDL